MRFHVSPQMACLRGCKVTLVTFVWLFSIVRFQMCFKSACTRGFKVTSVAFVCLFPNVRFQMSPQMACLTFESCTSEESLLQLVLLFWPKIDRVRGRPLSRQGGTWHPPRQREKTSGHLHPQLGRRQGCSPRHHRHLSLIHI